MTLKNKLDITDEVELAHEEERMSKLAALALYRDGTLDTLVPGTFSALKSHPRGPFW
jgi:cell filamentation protein